MSKEKSHQDYVYVVGNDDKPLMPTKKFGMVRWMLDTAKATVLRRQPFTIRLNYESTHYVQPVSVGMDTGYAHMAVSASTEAAELYSSQTELRTDIPKQNDTRRMYRKNRRYRKTRYRKPRFDNRGNKKKGWLPPSAEQRCHAHLKELKLVKSILPVSEVSIEVASFDTQKMMDPDISGVEYQRGPDYGHQNRREAVLYRDKYTCQHCGKSRIKDKTVRLEAHHIKFLSDGGSDEVNNQITLCHDCHKALHDKKITLNKKGVKSMSPLNVSVFKNKLIEEARKLFGNDVPVRRTYGSYTKAERIYGDIKKSHINDAFAMTRHFKATRCNYIFVKRQVRRHNRALHEATPKKGRGGVRRSTLAKRLINRIGTRIGDKITVNYNGNRLTGFVSGSSHERVIIKDIFGNKLVEKNETFAVKNILKTRYKMNGTMLYDTVEQDCVNNQSK